MSDGVETANDLECVRTVTLVRRDAIPTLRSVVVDGRERGLGILKDFRKSREIGCFIPEQARLAMAWVRLQRGEVLETHAHPTRSMIVMANGFGLVHGELETPMEGGDIVLIPEGCRHGFEGAGTDGFWALSIQFGESGLYEDTSRPLARFNDPVCPDALAELAAQNERFAQRHTQTKMFRLLHDGRLQDPDRLARFLGRVAQWSQTFQRALFARSAVTDDPRYSTAFRAHLSQEFGHDTTLAGHGGADLPWDGRFDAARTWFLCTMLSRDSVEKAVLVHFVLEVGSALFSRAACATLGVKWPTDYFAIHDAADDAHAAMGLELLRGLDETTYRRLAQVQAEGWSMLDLLCDRIAELTDE